jgi:hypothetical protein
MWLVKHDRPPSGTELERPGRTASIVHLKPGILHGGLEVPPLECAAILRAGIEDALEDFQGGLLDFDGWRAFGEVFNGIVGVVVVFDGMRFCWNGRPGLDLESLSTW